MFKMHKINLVFCNTSIGLILAYVSKLIELVENFSKFVGPCYSKYVPSIFQPDHHVVGINLQLWPEEVGIYICP